MNTFKYDKEQVILDKYTVIEQDRMRVIYNWLQYFSEASLRNEFEENGLVVDSLYSNVASKPLAPDSGEIAIVAKKSEL